MEIDQIPGRVVVDRSGRTVGHVEDVLPDVVRQQPVWMRIRLAGTDDRKPVPLRHVSLLGEEQLQIPYEREAIIEAPAIQSFDVISATQRHELYQHYSQFEGPLPIEGPPAGWP
jgi:hypothetical protein